MLAGPTHAPLFVALLTAVLLFQAGAVSPASVLADEPTSLPVPAYTQPPAPSPATEPQAAPSPTPTSSGEPLPDAAPPADEQAGVEREDLRTADSRTFEQTDGTFLTELFTGPVFYHPEGSADWQPIDLALEPVVELGSDTDARAGKGPSVLSLAEADSADGFVTLSGDGHTISFRLPDGTAPGRAGTKPVIDDSGHFADYTDFLPGGIGLRVFPRTDGVKTFLILPEKPAQASFSFDVDAPGLSLDDEKDGTFAFHDAAGNVVGRIPRPFLVDSSELEGRGGGI